MSSASDGTLHTERRMTRPTNELDVHHMEAGVDAANEVAAHANESRACRKKHQKRKKHRNKSTTKPVMFHVVERDDTPEELPEPKQISRACHAKASCGIIVVVTLVSAPICTVWLMRSVLSRLDGNATVEVHSTRPPDRPSPAWPPSPPSQSSYSSPVFCPPLMLPPQPPAVPYPYPLLPPKIPPQLPPPCGSPRQPYVEPPVPPMPFGGIVDALIQRFEMGKPSDNVEDAGLVVRMIDHLTDTDDWDDAPWLPSTNPRLGDRFSGSIINRRTPAIFMGKYGRGLPGFIISPGSAQASLMCGFTHDAGTVRAQCDPPGLSNECSPGCMGASAASRGISHWCDSPTPCHGLDADCHRASGGKYSYPTCPWPAEKLRELMELHETEIRGATCECCHWSSGHDDCSLYNEIIFSTAVMASSPAQMLANIEAVVFPTDRVQWVQNFAHAIHRAVARHGVHVPLLEYNALRYSSAEKRAFTIVEPWSHSM